MPDISCCVAEGSPWDAVQHVRPVRGLRRAGLPEPRRRAEGAARQRDGDDPLQVGALQRRAERLDGLAGVDAAGDQAAGGRQAAGVGAERRHGRPRAGDLDAVRAAEAGARHRQGVARVVHHRPGRRLHAGLRRPHPRHRPRRRAHGAHDHTRPGQPGLRALPRRKRDAGQGCRLDRVNSNNLD